MKSKSKKPIYKRLWFIILTVVIIMCVVGAAGSGEDKVEPEQIVYSQYDVSALLTDLDENALKASETYEGQYVSLTGKIGTIDSSGKYIDLLPIDDEWTIIGIQCYITNDEQKAAIMELSTGDTVTVEGKITSVGEVLGYSLDIDSIQ